MNQALRLFRNYGIALVVVGALIWFPITGFFLTTLTLGLLPSLICNLFMIHLAWAAWTRSVPLEWLVLPIACYGIWLGWVIGKTHAVALEKNKLESENHVTGSIPQNVTLVFPEGDLEIARRAKRHLAPPVRVFDGSIELSTIKASDMLCMLAKPNDPPSMKKFRCPTEPVSQPPADAIVFRQLERPDLHSGSRIFFHRYELTQKSGSTGDPVIGHFNFGRLSTPVWAPVFVAGCFLIDNPAAWLCDISPKLRRVAVGETGYASEYDPFEEKSDPVIATLANMLGVKYVGGADQP
jgi:hypothetical protein